MTKLEVAGNVSDEEKLAVDGAAVCLYEEKVYAGAEDGKVKVYDHHSLALQQEVTAHEYAVTDMITLGASLFTASVDCGVKVWDAATMTQRATPPAHEEAVRKMATNGIHVFAGDDKGEVRLYDVDGRVKATHSLMEEVWGVHAQDSLLYTVRDRGITIYQLFEESNKSSVVGTVEGRAPMVVEGEWLVSADAAGMSLVVRDNKRGSFQVKGELKGHEMIITALVGCGGGRVVSAGWDNKAILWDLATLKQVAACSLPACANALAASPDGCVFATGSGGFVCKLKIV
ncbi:F-box/WD repeat-containing protein sel-10-like [Eriocheir sinensis]|uniref:F-box/WD repeat-containing protein sel-10-like n=1 Tax=Eriocheir sinensis TaxID=95602 RepID=UPI0021C5F2E2|nr:F-box/WD repeat-containing protein sel-10-like [Eriocheir sinensis]XP_050692219.1 F-box/WD repeat-containing protein sel-10-like [Eriocheir sinensis]XP_050692220.1 F-box/WD repeat-containing protein sel-10-like [Eriocheir sinensis]XP_050692221.1 F-box/WD repeat-containing protein sel-10-like [Eriocheir sinensis]XP_050692222.1 F-box/WD repeat-containing protein sel-10-like [Eriocheir sinensis]XP_050692223.1 F-box/WD repeat-containing protein sel-10-like [Eriocheir sinensis]